ncbi:EamA family transporter, partial [Pseudomonas ogarae]
MSDQLDTAVRAYNVPRPQFGILLCLLSMLVFASQDGITKVLVKDLPIAQLVMVRYWVFLAFA